MPDAWTSHWRTPDAERRAAFLRLSAESLASKLGAPVVRALSSLENRVFELENRTIAKLYRPDRWGASELEEEHRFLDALDAAGVPVVRAIDRGEVDGIHYAIFPKIEGTSLPDDPDDALLGELGRLLARVHEVGALEPARNRLSLAPASFGLGNLRYLLEENVLPPEIRDRYVERVEAIVRDGERAFRSVPMQRVHGDFYAENCLHTSRGPVAIDFDDMMMGPAVQDVWILARTKPPLDLVEWKRRYDVIVQAYREVRPFEDEWIELVPVLRTLRTVWMNAWIASRWFDPLFREAYPTFRTLAYWQQQLERLA